MLTKEKSNFHFRLGESVRLKECVDTEFDWKVKRGFEKASVSRVSVSGELSVPIKVKYRLNNATFFTFYTKTRSQ